MQAGFGLDLSRVRVHAGSAASRSASALQASAYTLGNHIVFGSGQYNTESSRGIRLLAHEVTHTIQQSRGGAYPAPFSGSAHERAAESAADAVARGARNVLVPGGTTVGIARERAFLAQNYDPSHMTDEQIQSEMALVRMFLNSPLLAGEYDVVHARRALQRLQSVWDSRHPGASGAQKYTLHLATPTNIAYEGKEVSRGEAMDLLRRFRGNVESMLEVGVEGLAEMERIHDAHAIVGTISNALAWQRMPSESEWQPAKEAIQAGDGAYDRSDVIGCANAYQKASSITRSANRHLDEYREGTIKGAGRAVTGLEVTEVAAAAVVTIGTGGTTGVLLGAGYGGLQQVARQASEVHYGLRDKIDWAGIGFDTVVGVATGYLGGKLGNAVLGKLLRNPAVASIGRRVLSRVVSDLVAGRVGSVLHTSARSLFDRLRGRENLTWGEFADRLADQLTDPKSAAFDVIMGEANRRIASRLPGGPEGTPSPRGNRTRGETGGGSSGEPVVPVERSITSGGPTAPEPRVELETSPAPGVAPTAPEPAVSAAPPEHATSPAPMPEHAASSTTEAMEQRNAAKLHEMGHDEVPRIESGIGKERLEAIRRGDKDFVLDKALTFDVDEVLPVGQEDIKPQRAFRRAVSAENRQLLDPATNRQTKHLGIDMREVPSRRTPRPRVSVKADPNALITHRFSEVEELDALFQRAVDSVQQERGMRPTKLKAAINKEVRRLIAEDPGSDAVAIRKALGDIGFERKPKLGYTMNKTP